MVDNSRIRGYNAAFDLSVPVDYYLHTWSGPLPVASQDAQIMSSVYYFLLRTSIARCSISACYFCLLYPLHVTRPRSFFRLRRFQSWGFYFLYTACSSVIGTVTVEKLFLSWNYEDDMGILRHVEEGEPFGDIKKTYDDTDM